MLPEPIHEIYQMPDEAFAEIIRDVELMKQGCRVQYMVDSYEIIDYCFPVDPAGYSSRTAEQIADDQAALYEVFYGRELRPILIPDYETEVKRHLAYLQITAERAYHDLDLVQVLLGDTSIQSIKGLAREEILRRMEAEFNILLAVAMGIWSIGVDRFKQLVTSRVLRIGEMTEAFVAQAHGKYRETSLVRAIRDDLVRPLEDQNLVLSEIKRKMRSAEIDARAVDWLFYLNRAAQAEYGNRLDGRPVFVYLSSAHRTRRIFSLPAVRRMKTKVAGTPFSIQRDRTQLLAQLVCREHPASGGTWHDRAIENLKDLQALSQKIRHLEKSGPASPEARCAGCALGGRTPRDCVHSEICYEVARREDLRARIPNLGLMGELSHYTQLLQSKPRGARQIWCVEVLKDLLATENIGDLAIAKMRTILTIGLAQTSLTPTQGNTQSPLSATQPLDMAFLPVPPQVNWPEHRELVTQIFRMPYLLQESPGAGEDIVLDVVKTFEVLDRRVSAEEASVGFRMGEHELVRCLVYMTFGFHRNDQNQGDLMALEYAEKMVSKYAELIPEFDYVIIWTARRLGRYQQAHNAAKRSVGLRPTDPRFYHGRSVNAMCWMEDENGRQFCPVKPEEAIADARRAIELYCAMPTPPNRVISVHYNNIAWMRSRDWRAKEYDLSDAQKSLDLLRSVLPEEDWLPGFPEYFHTKAWVALEQYRSLKVERQGKATERQRACMMEKLDEANEALRKALTHHETELWGSLAEHIEAERRALAKLESAV